MAEGPRLPQADAGPENRSAALQALAQKWPDQTTRDLLAQRAVQDDNQSTRSAALQALAEKWPDQSTRNLLAQRAVRDKDGGSRSASLQALAVLAEAVPQFFKRAY